MPNHARHDQRSQLHRAEDKSGKEKLDLQVERSPVREGKRGTSVITADFLLSAGDKDSTGCLSC